MMDNFSTLNRKSWSGRHAVPSLGDRVSAGEWGEARVLKLAWGEQRPQSARQGPAFFWRILKSIPHVYFAYALHLAFYLDCRSALPLIKRILKCDFRRLRSILSWASTLVGVHTAGAFSPLCRQVCQFGRPLGDKSLIIKTYSPAR